jgi:CDP-diacylglycerol--glycerol-3-phosphate 3-phosphatidyltransferase
MATPWYAGRIVARGDGPASIANVANIITVVRILLAPVFVVLAIADDHAMGPLRWVAAVLFIVAIATDGVDGHLARSRGLVTDAGIFLDPLADKILTGAALVVLAIVGELWWWVVVVILVREVGITVLRSVALKDRSIPASRGGKLKTLLQAVSISVILLPLAPIVGPWYLWVGYVLIGAALVLTVLSGIDYLVKAARAPRSS